MIIIDNRCGSLTSANTLRKCRKLTLNEGSAVIYKNNVLTDIFVVKTWNELLKSVSSNLNSIIQKVIKKGSHTHLVIVGNKNVFLNRNRTSNQRGVKNLLDYLKKCSAEGIEVVECVSSPKAAKYLLEVDARPIPKIEEPVKEKPIKVEEPVQEESIVVREPTPEPVVIKIEEPIIEEPVQEEPKEDNIESEPTPEPEHVVDEVKEEPESIKAEEPVVIKEELNLDGLLVQAWSSIPGITSKIVNGLSSATTIAELPSRKPQDLSSVKYDTGTRFGVSRTRKLIEASKDKEVFKKILSVIPQITQEEIDSISLEYNLSDVEENLDKIVEKYGRHLVNLKVLTYKK